MKNWKLAELLNTPLGVVIVVGAVIAAVELLIMLAILPIIIPEIYWDFADPILLVIIVAPALYFLVFRKIQEDEQRLQQIKASAQDAIVIVDEQGRITDWNLAAQKMFQYSSEEAVGQPMHQLIAPPRYHADAARGFARFEETGKGPLIGKTTELLAMRKDGSEFSIEHSISAVKVKGRWHALGIMRDLTERKQVVEALQQSAARIEMLLNSVAEGIYGVDMQGNCTFINSAGLHLLGYQEATELIGKNMHSLIHHTRADGSHYPVAECRLYYCLQSNENAHVDDELFWRKDGSSFMVDYWSRPVRQDDKVVGAVVTFLDITERKETEEALKKSEARFRSYIELTGQLAWIADAEGKVVEDIPVWRAFTGQSEAQVKGHGWAEAIHPDDQARVMQIWLEALGRKGKYEAEFRVRRHVRLNEDYGFIRIKSRGKICCRDVQRLIAKSRRFLGDGDGVQINDRDH